MSATETTSSKPTRVTSRPTAWWRVALERRVGARARDDSDWMRPVRFSSPAERRAAAKFFNAAFRAEESGLRQAHELSEQVATWDPELARVLHLYGEEEGWHRELLTKFLGYLGAGIEPMGRVTRVFYGLYGRARRMETIVLTNLMFETIGSTTYRLALERVSDASVRRMLTILTRDESFHVPLNVHFLKRVLDRTPRRDLWRLKLIYHLLFVSLLALPFASRPKAGAFDGIGTLELSRAYAVSLAKLFREDSDLPFSPPLWLLKVAGIRSADLEGNEPSPTSVEAAELAQDRDRVRLPAP